MICVPMESMGQHILFFYFIVSNAIFCIVYLLQPHMLFNSAKLLVDGRSSIGSRSTDDDCGDSSSVGINADG